MKKNLLFVAFAFFSLFAYTQKANVTYTADEDSLPLASLSSEGIDSATISELSTAIKKGDYPNIHSLLIVRHNKLLYEEYFTGRDGAWGESLGRITFNKDHLHDLRSVTKSFVSACVGIAIDQGKIKSVDQRIFDFFPDYAALDTGLKSTITIKHLLTMSAGLEWDEEIPYSDQRNSEVRMGPAADKVLFVLSQQIEHVPGTVWDYSGGATQLLGVIVQRATGKRLDEFAKEFLFQPLGIKRFEWARYGKSSAASWGLRLRPRDMLKFGLLYLNNGNWKGKQIIPAQWVKESITQQISRDSTGAGYGYQFWTWNSDQFGITFKITACLGLGDQNIFIDITRDLVIVATAGNYNEQDTIKDVDDMISEYIYPAIFKNMK